MSHVGPYVGRFAPSPTGLLHAGSLVAALASWLDARAHGGRWLVRIEDVDTPRCQPGADQAILRQLADCALLPDAPPWWQSARGAAYEQALARLLHAQRAYPCACTRSAIAAAQAARGVQPVRGAALPYPGLCRPENGGLRGRSARAWRLHTTRCLQELHPQKTRAKHVPAQTLLSLPEHSGMDAMGALHWRDRRLGPQQQNVPAEVGDFVLRRADGLWAYQLAVVVDDAAQGITHIVRGEDLADNTPRQLLLQAALGLPAPAYLHTPLVLAADGHKLSKQNGAAPLDTTQPLLALARAARVLGLPSPAPHASVAEALAAWVRAWPDALARISA